MLLRSAMSLDSRAYKISFCPLISVMCCALLSRVGEGTSIFSDCAAAARAQGAIISLTLRGDTHGKDVAEYRRAVASAGAGNLIMGAEGLVYGSKGKKYNPDYDITVEAGGTQGPIIGIEDDAAIAVTYLIHQYLDAFKLLAKIKGVRSADRVFSGVLGSLADFALQAAEQRLAVLEKYIFMALHGSSFSKSAWAVTAHSDIAGDQNAIATFNDVVATGETNVLVSDGDAFLRVMKRFCLSLITEASKYSQERHLKFDADAAIAVLENPADPEKRHNFSLKITHSWRNELVAQNIAKIILTTMGRLPIEIVMGAGHRDPIAAIFRRELGDMANLRLVLSGYAVNLNVSLDEIRRMAQEER